MIQVNETPIIGKITQKKYCSTIKVTDYEQCPIEFLELVFKLSFVINTITLYPDLICVISNDNLDEFVYQLAKISSFIEVK